jgi:site-specific DNA-cytosine methylase
VINDIEIRHFHLFAGLGGGAKGFNRGEARVGSLRAKFRCIGGIDVDPAAIRDFTRAAGVPGTAIDLFSREQFMAFHGREPGPDWREATVHDLQAAAGGERPHIVFLSAPCKGFSGLLSETASRTAKYQALNGLTLRGVWLMLEAWGDDPPELIVFENVPRIANRGRKLLDQIGALLRRYGYAVAETTHDCGVIGGLAQSRKRFLLVARHMEKVPPFLYEPAAHRLRGVGEILDKLPLPGDQAGGPMHRVPLLHWKTWVRLAFVQAGADWRSLNRLRVEDGVLADFGILPVGSWRDDILGVLPWEGTAGTVTGNAGPTTGRFSVADPRVTSSREGTGYLGVNGWEEPSGTVTANGRPGSGAFSVADPRPGYRDDYGQFGVGTWQDPASTITSQRSPGQGRFSVADPRMGKDGPRFSNVYRVVAWKDVSPSVTGGLGPSAGGLSVADPRPPAGSFTSKYRVTEFGEAAGTVISASTTGQGAFAVADPRTGFGPATHHNVLHLVGWNGSAKTVTGANHPSGGALSVADPRPAGLQNESRKGHSYDSQAHYGVLRWQDTSLAVPGFAKHDRGKWSVADPRPAEGEPAETLPKPNDRLVAVIQAEDGTWHRPFTTLELAALQSLVDPEEYLELDGLSDSDWRERIGNAVPPAAAAAIASVMGRTLLLAWSGQTFMLSSEPIWVQPIAVALSVAPSLPAE